MDWQSSDGKGFLDARVEAQGVTGNIDGSLKLRHSGCGCEVHLGVDSHSIAGRFRWDEENCLTARSAAVS